MKLYPELKPRRQEHLAVGDGHQLYFEDCGNPDGEPVVVIHGGPGGAVNPRMRRYFDPQHWRIILFDQRGAGRSTPRASLHANTTDHLIADMERLREELGVDRWVLFGGSWGATLALLYAQAHPQRSLGLILRGSFLCRQRDIDWLYRDGAGRFFPEPWQALLDAIPEDERDDIVTACHRRLSGDDADEALARLWSGWEAACSTLRHNAALEKGVSGNALPMARIESHYFVNGGFIGENRILERMETINHLPAILVHGRYDMVCPLEQSMELHRRWPASDLRVIPEAGHSAFEPAIERALVQAATDLARQLEETA